MTDDESDRPAWWGEDTERVRTMVPESFVAELAATYPEARSLSEAAWLAMFDGVRRENECGER